MSSDEKKRQKQDSLRARNKIAAAKSRQKKVDRIIQLEKQLDAVVDFLRAQMNHLPYVDHAKFEEIETAIRKTMEKKDSNVAASKGKQAKRKPPSANEYLPTSTSQHHGRKKRSLLSPPSDIVEPELKKTFEELSMDSNPTSVDAGDDLEVARPPSLGVSGLPRSAAPLNIPSVGISTSHHIFTPLFGDNDAPIFLTQSTGLTPTAPAAYFVAQIPTSLQTSEADLRPL